MLKRFFIKNKENAAFILILFLLSIFFLHNIISTSKIMDNIHYINDITFVSYNLKESLFKYGQLHLWTPYYYSGQPLYAQPEYYFLDFNFLYLFLFRNISIAMNLAALTYFFLSGLGMYYLFLTFDNNRKGAFIAAIIYMFSGYMRSFVISGNLNVLAGYSLIPFAFMFFVKSLRSKEFIKNSIFCGLFIALQIFAGGTLFLPYEAVLFGIYFLFYLLGENAGKRMLKLASVSIVIILVGFGISAIKLLPGLEFLKLSNRGIGVPYQEYIGEPVDLSNFLYLFVTNLFSKGGISASIGIMGFLLLVLSLRNYKKKYIAFSIFVIVFSILMAIKGPLADLFFNIPIFNQLRHIDRIIFLVAFAGSILAGNGLSLFLEKTKNRIKINSEKVIFIIIILLILTEIMFLQRFPQSIDIVKPKSIEINDYLSKDTSRFRTVNLALSTLIGASGYNYLAQLGIGEIKGGSGIWFNDYLEYLAIAQQTKPAKLWGLLNNKYVISDRELNISSLRFIGKFTECKRCVVWEAYGPYLYENLEFMPRAFFVDKSILVIDDNRNMPIVYALLANDNFDPKKAVIVNGKDLGRYSLEDLKKYSAVIITSGLVEDVSILKSYVDNGGILLPNIFNNKNSINQKDIEELLKKLDGKFEETKIIQYENNKVVYDANNKKGFLVLSERFSNFPGWYAIGKNNKEILKANGIITAVFVDNDNTITFKYKPESFRKGLLISLSTSVLLIIYFIFLYIKNVGDKNKIRS